MSDLSAAQRAVATIGLPDASTNDGGAPRAGRHLGHDELTALIGWAARERLDGLLWLALTTGRIAGPPSTTGHRNAPSEGLEVAGSETAPGPTLDERARHIHLTGLRSSLAAEATAATAIATLRDAGIAAHVFKGLANAHLDYDTPQQRTFFDADLLVHRSDFGAAIEALADAGFTRTLPPLRERWEQRFARATELRSPDGVELDLHASLATGYFGEILDHDALRDQPATVHLGGVDCDAFNASARLLISSYAIVLSRGPGIRLLRDLAQQLLVTGADWREAARLAGDGAAVLADALLQTGRTLGIDHEAIDWATGVEPSPTASRALAHAADAHDEGWSADARSTMLALGPMDRIRFLAGVVLPSRSNLRARGRTMSRHLTPGRRTSAVQDVQDR